MGHELCLGLDHLHYKRVVEILLFFMIFESWKHRTRLKVVSLVLNGNGYRVIELAQVEGNLQISCSAVESCI